MKIEATVGVCIGPGQSLLPGERADVDNATARFLVSINKARLVPEEEPPAPAPAPAAAEPPAPVKTGKKEK